MSRSKTIQGKRRRWWLVWPAAGIVICAFLLISRVAAVHYMEKLALTTGPNGAQTPASVGLPFERVAIPSISGHLDGYAVVADPRCPAAPAILIYHGIGETISEWVGAQRFLYDHCVSSIVFDYTGSGNSPRPARFQAIGKDTVAAYEFAHHYFGKPIYILGHSMGNGPMLEGVPQFSIPPAGIIVANAFASLRDHIQSGGKHLYRLWSHIIPDWWDNVLAIEKIDRPVLVIHSDTDRVNAIDGGRRVFAVAHQPKKLIILHGFNHNDLYQHPADAWWQSILLFVHAPVARLPSAQRQ